MPVGAFAQEKPLTPTRENADALHPFVNGNITQTSSNDLMILKDPSYGFDGDSNDQAIKVSGGASFTAFRENDLR